MNDYFAIICVDDEEMILIALRQQIEDAIGDKCIVEVSTSGEEALDIISELVEEEKTRIVLIISDWLMPGMKGDEFLIKAHKICPNVEKIILSGQADDNAILRAKSEANLREFIYKPWDANYLINVIKDTCKINKIRL